MNTSSACVGVGERVGEREGEGEGKGEGKDAVMATTYIHTCTHTLLEGTLMWTQVVHVHTHYTCEQCRQQKQQTQASSEAIQMHVPVQISRHLRVY